MLMAMRGASSRPGPTVMTSPCEGFPFAASDTMMLRFLGSQSNPERYQIYFRDRGADLLIKTPLDTNWTGIVFISTPEATIRNRPLTCGFFKMAPYVDI